MKNMKVSLKLLLSFAIVAVMALAVGLVGIFGMMRMDSVSTDMYEIQTMPLSNLSKVVETLQRMRVNTREYLMAAEIEDSAKIDQAHTAIEGYKSTMKQNLDAFAVTIVNPDVEKLFNEARKLYEGAYVASLDRCYSLALAYDHEGIRTELDNARADTELIVGNFDKCMEFKISGASDASDDTARTSRNLLLLIAGVLLLAVIVALVSAVYVSGLISKPVTFMKEVLLKIGMKGDLEFTDAEYRQTEEYAKSKDEVGESMSMLLATIRRLTKVGESLEIVANGDLTTDIDLLSDRDTMGLSLKKMLQNLNNMFSEIQASTIQVSTGSKQIADGAQSLAQGSTEQASAVQQLSSSISEIAMKTKDNAQMADQAANLAETIMENAQKGSAQMDQMTLAVQEINEASQNISKVISVIDNIAFQTNILALNAAVEAARAGQHGKGFAVVAEEVRALASKSAEAASDTSSLIANSMEKAELGARIAGETATSLADIVLGITESNKLVGDIARSSEEQSHAISEINKGIDQVAQVVQQNSATAEQSAAASQEMSGQSNMLEELITRFKLKDSRGRSTLGSAAPRRQLPPSSASADSRTDSSGGGNSFGKY